MDSQTWNAAEDAAGIAAPQVTDRLTDRLADGGTEAAGSPVVAGDAGGNTDQAYRYWGFISYSHDDQQWASWLHKKMEAYPVPRRFVGRRAPGGVVPKRFYPVFRDRDELAGADSLGKVIFE